jgi:two-component system response regulator RpfG
MFSEHTELPDKLASMLAELRERFEPLRRMAIAIYDPETDRLATFAHGTMGEPPFEHYEVPLAEAPTLAELAANRRARVLDDLSVLKGSHRTHTQAVLAAGYASSYTLPIYDREDLLGFLFFDAVEPGFFTPAVVHDLAVYAELVTLFVSSQLAAVRTLRGVVQTALGFSRFRDEETGSHLDRMCRYAKLIAMDLAAAHGMTDERVAYIGRFATLHDVGKVAIPDGVLLKPGALTDEERDVMREHVIRGVQLVDKMVESFGLSTVPHVDVLRNIVAYHHEALDGSGYPHGLEGEAIPIEARITTVADVFDALTSRRPYKPAWDNDKAFAFLRDHPGRFDAACVAALAAHGEEIAAIQTQFPEDPLG